MEKLLELADRFMLPAAKRHLELFMLSTEIAAIRKLKMAARHDLDTLLIHSLKLFKTKEEFNPMNQFSEFSDKIKARIFDRHIELSNVTVLLAPQRRYVQFKN